MVARSNRPRFLVPALAVSIVLLAGCSARHDGTGGSPGPSSTTHRASSTSGSLTGGDWQALNESDGFRIAAKHSVPAFSPPGNVTYTWAITNTGAAAKYASPPSCRPERNPEVAISDAGGNDLAWRRWDQPACMIATQDVDFPPGASFTSTWTWDGTVYDGSMARQAPPGHYVVTATFSGDRNGTLQQVSVSLGVDVQG